MIDQVLLGRIEEGLRTDTKIKTPTGYHARADYFDILMKKGWGKGQIERITGWNMWESRNRPNAMIAHAKRVHVETVPAGTHIHGVPFKTEHTKQQATVLMVGPLKIAIEGTADAIEELAARMVESARQMRDADDTMEIGA